MRLGVAVQQQHWRPATTYNPGEPHTMNFCLESLEAGKKRRDRFTVNYLIHI
jgi:hypothetical protein